MRSLMPAIGRLIDPGARASGARRRWRSDRDARRRARALADPVASRLPPMLRSRVFGAGGAIGLILASIGYGIAISGNDAAANPQLAALARIGGFDVETVEISGHLKLDEGRVLDLMGVGPGSVLPLIDADLARAHLLDDPWIVAATVRKLYPRRLVVSIEEAVPMAIWRHDGMVHVIDRHGTVLTEIFTDRLPDLPLVTGAGAEREAAALFDLLAATPTIGQKTVAAHRIGARRWNLTLAQGIVVLLPEAGVSDALNQLADLEVRHRITARAIDRIDMRLPDRLVVRPAQPSDDETEAGS